MTSPRRPVRAIAASLSLLLFAPHLALAQDAPVADIQIAPAPQGIQTEDPWLYRGGDIPVDPQWVFGELDSGLRYAVRENGVPPGQVSIRIRIDAGSLYERENELGFAHLMEHLSFRESQYLEQGAAIPTWQRLGATFGSDTNAETSPTHTVYKLDLPNADPAKLDESFRLLSGMMRAPVLSAENLAAEVPIVLAELRENSGPARRTAEATRRVLFADQLLANRSPIGTPETLRGATPESIQAFHDRWYRPDATTVVAVGDADPQLLAGLVEKYFGDWTNSGPATPAPDFGTPAAPAGADRANPVGETAVLVEPTQPRAITLAWLRPWEQVVDNLEYNRGLMLSSVAQAIINRRLEARARGNASYLVASVGRDDVSRSADGTFVSIVPLGDDWDGALADVRGVIADALATPPTQEEIDRELAEFDVAFANRVEQESIQAGASLADDLVNAVDIREMVASPQVAYDLFTGMRARFNPQEVFARTRDLFDANVIRSVLVSPDAVDGGEGALQAALEQNVDAAANSRIAAQTVSFEDLPAIGAPGTIVAQGAVSQLGVERVTFANGITALLWKVDNEPGRATVKVRFGAGYRAFAPEDAPYIQLGEMALVGQGLGPLGQEELDRIATGRKFGFNFGVEEGVFTLSADTRNADIPDQLYLFAGKLAMPRWDANPVLRAISAGEIGYDSFGSSAVGVLNRDLEYILSNRDPRFATPSPEALDKVTPDGFRAVWEPILKTGPIEVLVFGDIDKAAVIDALTTTFGALPPRETPSAAVLSRPVGFPNGTPTPIKLTHSGEADQAAAVVAWETGGGTAGIRESRRLEILTQVFNNRLMDALREQAGASYAPQVFSKWPLDIDSGGQVVALAQLSPGMTDAFFTEADRIARELAATGPTEDELQRVTEPLYQLLMRVQTGHTFWLSQFEGASTNPERLAALGTLLPDYTRTTPEEMRALAAKYLLPSEAVKVVVVPEAAQ